MPTNITQGRRTRDAVKDLMIRLPTCSVDAKGAVAAASDLAPGFKSAGGT